MNLIIEKEDIDIVKLLLANGKIDHNIIKTESIAGFGKTPTNKIIKSNVLFSSIMNNKNKVVKFLLSEIKKMPINLNDKLFESKIGEEIEIFEKSLLYVAVEYGNIEAVQLLLSDNEINVNEKSIFCLGNMPIREKSPLHLATELGKIEIIKLLLKHKDIDPNIQDDQGKRPINYALNDDIIKLFNS